MNCSTLQYIARFGIMIIMAIHVFALTIEGATTTNADYSMIKDFESLEKPRSESREIRGFKPHSMSTAIGFGKRHVDFYEAPKLSRHEATMPPHADFTRRFPIEWLVQYLKMNLDVARKVEKNLLPNNENVRPSVEERYKMNKRDVIDYYDE